MSERLPHVSIGMIVYNGENFITEAIESILAQTYGDFELIISDNASTDNTEAISREYATRDDRIRYVRNQKNLGSAGNANQTIHMATGKYYKLAAHDDLLAPTYLQRCVEVLDADPSVVLCHTQTRLINDDGSDVAFDPERGAFVDNHGVVQFRPDPRRRRLDHRSPVVRFSDFVALTINVFEIFGVMRLETLRQTRLMRGYFSSDKPMLAELILRGRFIEIPEELFMARCHPKQASIQSAQERAQVVDPEKPEAVLGTPWKNLAAYLDMVRRAPLRADQKVGCWLSLSRLLLSGNTWMRLLKPGPFNYFGIDFSSKKRVKTGGG